jgi:hypothetical protein
MSQKGFEVEENKYVFSEVEYDVTYFLKSNSELNTHISKALLPNISWL